MPRQTDFSAGEISPLLHARTDAPWFAKGLRSLLNFFVSKQGAAHSRPGTTFLGNTKNSPLDLSGPYSDIYAVADKAKLIPFNAADDEGFVLVFQGGAVEGGTLQIIGTIQGTETRGFLESAPGVRYELITPYSYEDLQKLHYAQVGEVLTLVTPNWDAYELRHVSDVPVQWTFTKAVTAPLQLENNGVTSKYRDAGGGVLDTTTGFTIDNSVGGGVPGAADTDHPVREWQWIVTALYRDNKTGELIESLGDMVFEDYDGVDYASSHATLTTDNFPIYPDLPVTLRRELGPLAEVEDITFEAYNIYRGRGGLFGFVGQTTSREFIDVGDAPNLEIQPPLGTNPFSNTGEATTLTAPLTADEDTAALVVIRRADRPSAVAYFENRRVFAGLTRREADVVASAQGDYDNYDERKPFDIAGEAVVFAIAARRRGRIRHLVSQRRLVVLSAAASYSFGGAEGAPLDFDSVSAPLIEEVGANDVTPAVVSGTVFFARAKGRGLRALDSQGANEGFKGFDASVLAEHLFRGTGKSVVDMAYAEDPWSLLWVVLEDGTLLSMTYEPGGMLAWSRHFMGYNSDGDFVTTGTVESVCAIPEGDEDGVYLVVKRTISGVVHRYIERMTSRHERGGCVIDASTPPVILTPPDYICVDSALAYAGPAATTFTGLEHLEGMENVYVVAQGHPVYGPYTVTGGSVTCENELTANIDGPAGARLVAFIGLLYHCEMELLDVAGGEARGRNKQVTHVGFEVDQAKGILAGQDFDNLDDQPSREVADDFGVAPLQTNFFFVAVRGTYDYSARAVLRQAEPLPVTVLGVTRKLDVGDSGGS